MADDKEAQVDDMLTPRSRAARDADEKPVPSSAVVGYGVVSMGLFAADTFINLFYLQFLLDYGRINVRRRIVCVFTASKPSSNFKSPFLAVRAKIIENLNYVFFKWH